MNPSDKNPEIDYHITKTFGFDRRKFIEDNHCVPAPIGCGRSVNTTGFRDERSLREFRISGLCQECQDLIFGK